MNHRAQDWRNHSDFSRECCHWISTPALAPPTVADGFPDWADAFPDGADAFPDGAVAPSPDLTTGLRRTPSGTNPRRLATLRDGVFPTRA